MFPKFAQSIAFTRRNHSILELHDYLSSSIIPKWLKTIMRIITQVQVTHVVSATYSPLGIFTYQKWNDWGQYCGGYSVDATPSTGGRMERWMDKVKPIYHLTTTFCWEYNDYFLLYFDKCFCVLLLRLAKQRYLSYNLQLLMYRSWKL